jgi:transposase InsO family protein
MTQIARNLTDDGDGFLVSKKYLIHDRDPLFTQEFQETLAAAGVSVVRLPARSPNLNAYAERFVRSIKESCLDRMILFGGRSLCRAVQEFVAHYHFEHNHQGLDNQLIFPDRRNSKRSPPVECRQRLGGMLNYYYRQAA